MLKKLRGQSRISEVNAVCKRMIGAFQNSSLINDEYLVRIFNDLQTRSAQLTTAINPTKALSILEDKDQLRDKKVSDLYEYLKGCTRHPDPILKNSAITLFATFNKYGIKIIRENYASESGLLASLLEDFDQQPMLDAMANVGGSTEMVAQIKSAQDDFEASRIAFEEGRAADGSRINASKIKMEILKLINGTLVDYLRGMAGVDAQRYGAFRDTVAQIIDSTNAMVAGRQGAESNAEE